MRGFYEIKPTVHCSDEEVLWNDEKEDDWGGCCEDPCDDEEEEEIEREWCD